MSENTKTKTETKQVSALIEKPLYDALWEHRWEAKADRFSDVVKLALSEYAENHGLTKSATETKAAAAPAK